MKKKYTTPTCTAIGIDTAEMLAASLENEYGNDQGRIKFSSTKVDADEAD